MREFIADIFGIVFGHGLFVVRVGDSDSLRDWLFAKYEVEEIEIRFVGVRGCTVVWSERWGATNTAGIED